LQPGYYLVYTCICTSLSFLFINAYKLNQWQASLVYHPFGIGLTVLTFFPGPMLDKAYRNAGQNEVSLQIEHEEII
jgi:hypothetical protein